VFLGASRWPPQIVIRSPAMALPGLPHVGDWPDPPVPDIDDRGFIVPPWVKYPNIPARSIGWRMGIGEDHAIKFHEWYMQQSDDVRLAVRSRYPEPEPWSGYFQRRSGAG
jgi:hypothetical protein